MLWNHPMCVNMNLRKVVHVVTLNVKLQLYARSWSSLVNLHHIYSILAFAKIKFEGVYNRRNLHSLLDLVDLV